MPRILSENFYSFKTLGRLKLLSLSPLPPRASMTETSVSSSESSCLFTLTNSTHEAPVTSRISRNNASTCLSSLVDNSAQNAKIRLSLARLGLFYDNDNGWGQFVDVAKW
mmetsp:Transcript_34293/g.50418  ORF Transcript_34293/g.50418 Transcript_34293/m.50418 type:complete len:110 (+) Transcript_34293:62-391(+)